jgi:hypothetical protein
MLSSPVIPGGGKSINLTPSGAAQTWRFDACAPLPTTTKVTPPIVAPLQKAAPQGIGNGSIATIRVSINAAALTDSSNNDNNNNDDAKCSFFGELANPDFEDLLPHDISGNFIALFVGSRKCQKSYTKARKIKIFYEALTVNKKSILGNSPPREVTEKFNLWSQAVKQQGKWTIDGIADSVYFIAKHVHNHQERIVKRGGSKSNDSKVVALLLMYHFFIAEIDMAKVILQSQNKAAAKSLQQHKSKPVKPLPTNFCYDASKVCVVFVFFHGLTDIS